MLEVAAVNTVEAFEDGSVKCTCGATAQKGDAKRFQRRHPSLCSDRKKLAHDLAQGTRCVDAAESDEHIGRRWDSLERVLGGEPR